MWAGWLLVSLTFSGKFGPYPILAGAHALPSCRRARAPKFVIMSESFVGHLASALVHSCNLESSLYPVRFPAFDASHVLKTSLGGEILASTSVCLGKDARSD